MKDSRRGLLRRALLLIGGGASVVAGGIGLSERSRPRSSAPGESLTLYGRNWHVVSRDLARGELPSTADRMLGFGTLHHSSEGPAESVGDFLANYVSLHQPGLVGHLASLEQHTFNLRDGSIIGSGTTREGLETEDEFAIVGGTGRYAGARGTYILRQSQSEFGGDGTATITFKFITEGLA